MIEFVNYDKEFLSLSWGWLNDRETKRLTNTPDFTKDQQEKWFDNLSKNSNYFIKGIEYNGDKIGVVGLKNITDKEGEYWGYIGENKHRGKGVGGSMIAYILDFAKVKKLENVYLKVVGFNKVAINLYKKKGFVINNKLSNKEELYMDFILPKNKIKRT